MSPNRRVVITGLGAVTPVGNTAEAFWAALVAGRSGIGPNTLFNTEGLDCTIAGLVRDFDAKAMFGPKLARQTESFTHYAMSAAREAWAQSGLAASGVDPTQVGVVMGSGIGGIGYVEECSITMHERGPGRVSPFLVPKVMPNAAPANVAMDLGLRGPNFTLVTACAAGTNAIGEAAEIIRRGAARVMIAGGAEASICRTSLAGFENMKALCTDGNDHPEKASRPFDLNRSGFVMGEGAGALVLEDYEYAAARGAVILADVAGYGTTSDAYHITAPSPDGEGARRAMRLALEQAGLPPSAIGYINAHGTSTSLNDKMETEAIKGVFGDGARGVPISSTKSMTGHLLGAAGAIEAVAVVMALIHQMLPPTINLETPDPECDLDYVPNQARPARGLTAAMSNSLGFGGHNAVIVLTRGLG